MHLKDSGFLQIGSHSLEYRMIGPRPDRAPTIVMLHEGLGCVGLWNDFPDKLQQATRCGVFVYSRPGYGQSSPVGLPRPLSYMHDEARDMLPALLDAIGFRRGLLLSHSDGASIEEARKAYETGDLRQRLTRWHKDVDNAFRGWNGAWLDPEFRKWDITEQLGYIRVPILIVQGEDDQYGTVKQIEEAERDCYCPVEVALLPGAKHSPQRDAPTATLKAIAGFVADVLRLNEWEQAA